MNHTQAKKIIRLLMDATHILHAKADRIHSNISQTKHSKIEDSFPEFRSLERQVRRCLHELNGIEQRTENILKITTR